MIYLLKKKNSFCILSFILGYIQEKILISLKDFKKKYLEKLIIFLRIKVIFFVQESYFQKFSSKYKILNIV